MRKYRESTRLDHEFGAPCQHMITIEREGVKAHVPYNKPMKTADAISDAIRRYHAITRVNLENIDRTLTSCDFQGTGPLELRYEFVDGTVMTVELMPDIMGVKE